VVDSLLQRASKTLRCGPSSRSDPHTPRIQWGKRSDAWPLHCALEPPALHPPLLVYEEPCRWRLFSALGAGHVGTGYRWLFPIHAFAIGRMRPPTSLSHLTSTSRRGHTYVLRYIALLLQPIQFYLLPDSLAMHSLDSSAFNHAIYLDTGMTPSLGGSRLLAPCLAC
jgi:hypothetical protein